MEYTKIQLRCDTLANWATYNPTLALGEFGYESDTKKAKIGDGLTPYNNLQYCFDVDKMTELYSALENVETIISDATGILQEVETATANAITATANANTATSQANTATSSANTATANANSKITEMEGVIDDVNDLLNEMESALGAMETATTNAVNATANAITATTNANQAIAGANNATYSANQAAQNANTASTNVSAKITDINNAISRANTATSSANTATANTEVAIREAYEARTETILATNEAISAITNAETATANAITATTNANTATANANTATTQANTAKNATIQATQNAITATANANTATQNANTATQNANTATANAQTATTNAINATNEAIEVTEAVDGRITNLEETKANKDGYYKLLGVGVADDLAGRGDGVSATFTYRTAGGDADIADGTATIQSIKGNSIVWNQMCTGSFSNYNAKSVNTTDGITRVNLKAGGYYNRIEINNIAGKIVARHKYLVKGFINDFQWSDKGFFNLNLYNWGNPFNGVGYCYKGKEFAYITDITNLDQTNNTIYIQFIYNSSTIINDGDFVEFSKFQFFDLTQMFGSGNEPTIEEFKNLFPLDYYNYNAGEIINFNGSKIRTIGFNQWDEEWRNGGYNITDGAYYTHSGYLSNVNPIKVIPNANYYCKNFNYIFFYDGNMNFISYQSGQLNHTITTPINCHYINFTNTGISTYDNNICFNLSWSGYRNGEYEPYWEFERNLNIENIMYDGEPLFPDGLCLAGNVRDEISSDKAVKRVYKYTFTGNERIYDEVPASGLYSIFVPNIKRAPQTYSVVGILYTDSKYHISTQSQWTNLNYAIMSDTNQTNAIMVRNIDYINNGSGLLQTFVGKTIYYELANPIEVEFDEPLNLSYKVSDFGTEEILPTNTATPTTTPFIGTILYGFNATDTLRRLPTEYLSINSLDSLINAFAPYFTITYNWDDNNNKYNFSVVPVEPTNITE